MSEPLSSPPGQSWVSRAEHDALRAAHTVAMHRLAIVVLLALGAVGFVAYSGYRDFEQFKAARAAEKAVKTAATPGAPPQPIVIQVPSTPVIAPSGFLGRGGGSGQTFNRRQFESATAQPAEVQHKDAQSGAVTVVRCPTGEPTTANSTDAKGVVTTIYACPPAPPAPPNVTRFDPPTEKDRKALEAMFPRTPLASYDLLGQTADQPPARTPYRYAAFVPKGGGDLDLEKYTEPRSTWAWGRHFELYGEAFRQQTFGVGPGGIAAQQPGYGLALGAMLDVFRYKDTHFQPFAEGGTAPGGAQVRYGVRVPACFGAECP